MCNRESKPAGSGAFPEAETASYQRRSVELTKSRDGDIVVLAPYSEGFVRLAKEIGGQFGHLRRNGKLLKAWFFKASQAATIGELVRRFFDINSGLELYSLAQEKRILEARIAEINDLLKGRVFWPGNKLYKYLRPKHPVIDPIQHEADYESLRDTD